MADDAECKAVRFKEENAKLAAERLTASKDLIWEHYECCKCSFWHVRVVVDENGVFKKKDSDG